jgi:hypothetical protein
MIILWVRLAPVFFGAPLYTIAFLGLGRFTVQRIVSCPNADLKL